MTLIRLQSFLIYVHCTVVY